MFATLRYLIKLHAPVPFTALPFVSIPEYRRGSSVPGAQSDMKVTIQTFDKPSKAS